MVGQSLPNDLPVPIDDGACDGLVHSQVPSILLPSTDGTTVNLATLSGTTLLFCYPRTAAPDETVPDSWNAIPGARGCTPRACSIRDNFSALRRAGASGIFGLSTQDTPYQQEAKERLHLPYELLSDEKLEFARALKLPTFEWSGRELTKRCTLAVADGKVVKVWYPVFPPDESPTEVLKWLKGRGAGDA